MHDRTSLKLRLEFLSDWHVGEGAGARGHVDAIVRRDPADGMVYVPAKTLTGIWRDGCERVARGLDGAADDGPWQRLLLSVFGSDREAANPITRAARLAVGPARLDAQLRRALTAEPDLAEALVFLKPGVQLDEEGVAKSQMLRFEEVALAGAKLTAEAELDLAGEWRDAAQALLAAGALAVERLGGKRRRGTGRCRLSLDGAPEGSALAAALARLPAGEPPGPVVPSDLRLTAAETGAALGWHRCILDLELRSPVLVPDATLGNLVTTRDHIPGSLLLPALDRWLAALLADRRTLALAAGAVQVRNAYPAPGGERLLPVPAALFKLKEGETYSNHLFREPAPPHHPPDHPGPPPAARPQRKQQRSGYVGRTGLPRRAPTDGSGEAQPEVLQVSSTAITHATLDDESQRPTERVGGVFTYQAIRPDQRFQAEVWISKGLIAELPSDWLRAAPRTIRIGRAKKDDYGQVQVTARMAEPADPPDAKVLTVWLASPLLLRDAALNPSADPAVLARSLESELGVRLTPRPRGAGRPAAGSGRPVPEPDQGTAQFARPWRDEGWTNAWQMRRPTRFGLAPGSCFAFDVEGRLDSAALARLEARGLGERRGEGYGELVFNALLLADAEVPVLPVGGSAPGGSADSAADTGTPADPRFTAALERRAALLAIRRRASEHEQAFRARLGWSGGTAPRPPNTQLGALRALFEPLRDPAGLQRIASWLAALQRNPARREKWPQDTQEVLAAQVAESAIDAVWTALGLPDGPAALTQDRRDLLKRELRCEALRALWLAAISRQLNENNRTGQPSDRPAGGTHGA